MFHRHLTVAVIVMGTLVGCAREAPPANGQHHAVGFFLAGESAPAPVAGRQRIEMQPPAVPVRMQPRGPSSLPEPRRAER